MIHTLKKRHEKKFLETYPQFRYNTASPWGQWKAELRGNRLYLDGKPASTRQGRDKPEVFLNGKWFQFNPTMIKKGLNIKLGFRNGVHMIIYWSQNP